MTDRNETVLPNGGESFRIEDKLVERKINCCDTRIGHCDFHREHPRTVKPIEQSKDVPDEERGVRLGSQFTDPPSPRAEAGTSAGLKAYDDAIARGCDNTQAGRFMLDAIKRVEQQNAERCAFVYPVFPPRICDQTRARHGHGNFPPHAFVPPNATQQAKREATDEMVDEFCNNFQPQEGNCGTMNIAELRDRVRRGLKAALDV